MDRLMRAMPYVDILFGNETVSESPIECTTPVL